MLKHKIVCLLAAAAILSSISVISVLASPKQALEGDYTWESIDGKWTCFRQDGEFVRGWISYENEIYFLSDGGVMETGWVKDGASWYYLDEESGALARNQWVDNYYVDKDGKMSKIN